MPFIKFKDYGNYDKGWQYLRDTLDPYVMLASVWCLDRKVLLEFDKIRIQYREIQEDELKHELPAMVYEYYLRKKAEQPEIFFEELRTLPPLGSVEIQMQFDPSYEQVAEKVFAEYVARLKKSSVFNYAEVGKDADFVPRISITAIVKKADLESIIQKLESEGIEHDGFSVREQPRRM